MGDTAIWGYLHDGSLDRADRIMPYDITVHISIPYLRKAFQPAGEGFVLKLMNCTRFELESDDGTVLTDPGQIAERSPEILSIESESPLAIYTTMGTLTLVYDALELALDSGQSVTVQSVDQASAEYWQAWSQRHGGSA